jgi:hypothetical protein
MWFPPTIADIADVLCWNSVCNLCRLSLSLFYARPDCHALTLNLNSNNMPAPATKCSISFMHRGQVHLKEVKRQNKTSLLAWTTMRRRWARLRRRLGGSRLLLKDNLCSFSSSSTRSSSST